MYGDLARCVVLFHIGGWNLVVLVHTDFTETHDAQSHHTGNSNINIPTFQTLGANWTKVMSIIINALYTDGHYSRKEYSLATY